MFTSPNALTPVFAADPFSGEIRADATGAFDLSGQPSVAIPSPSPLTNGNESSTNSTEKIPAVVDPSTAQNWLLRCRDLTQRGNGSDGSSYWGVDSLTNDLVTIHYLSGTHYNNERSEAIDRQLRSVNLLKSSSFLKPLCIDLNRERPVVITMAIRAISLTEALPPMDWQNRLRIAAELSSALTDAHRLGIALSITQIVNGQAHSGLPIAIYYGQEEGNRQPNLVVEPFGLHTISGLEHVEVGGHLSPIECDRMHLTRKISDLLSSDCLESIRSCSGPTTSRLTAAIHARISEYDSAAETCNYLAAQQWRDLLAELQNACSTCRPETVKNQHASYVHGLATSSANVATPPSANVNSEPRTDDTAELEELAGISAHDVEKTSQRSSGIALENAGIDITSATQCSQSSVGFIPPSIDTLPEFIRVKPVQVGDTLGRYQLDEKLGQGGMGIVFKGTDLSDGKCVAIKVLRRENAPGSHALRRFEKEARILSGIQNDFVTRLYEVNEDNGTHYIAMEYIAGTDLKQWIKEQKEITEETALRLVADIARGLADAHQQGIVHRDIKPENILLQVSKTSRYPERLKISDFGIARHVEQSASLDVTRAGAVLGTPLYMSPEQCKGTEAISPASDVYALGITLFELLCGQVPFKDSDPLKLAAMHCFDRPPNVTHLNRQVSDISAQIVARALSKKPADRYLDAQDMLNAIERALGKSPDKSHGAHCQVPPHRDSKLWQADFTWHLKSSPKELWPFISDTDRLNRASGLPAGKYKKAIDSNMRVKDLGSFKLGIMNLSWETMPTEWVEGQRYGILRHFNNGPFKWFLSTVELEAQPDGGTLLRHSLKIEPRNWFGRVMATVEAGWKARKSLEKVYKRIDQSLSGQSLQNNAGVDPFEPPPTLNPLRKRRLAERIEMLIRQGVSPEIANRIGDYLATASPKAVAKIRPLAMADQLKIDATQCLDAMLRSSSVGLVSLQWDILCPTCRVAAQTKQTLKEIADHTNCEACNVDFRSDISSAVELIFSVHPEIRDADFQTYCLAGPNHAPHVVAQVHLQAGTQTELELRLAEGDYLLRSPQMPRTMLIEVVTKAASARREIKTSEILTSQRALRLRSDRQQLTIVNDSDNEKVIRVERTIPRNDIVTASHAASLPLFRQLFPDQVFSSSQLMSTEVITILCTSVYDVDSLYRTLGDAKAFGHIRQHLDRLEHIVIANRGAVVKTVGEGILAAFKDSSDAVAAAIEMRSSPNLSEGDENSLNIPLIPFGVGVHSGSMLVATVNDRIDYIGTQARAAAGLGVLAGQDLLITESVFADPLVAKRLQDAGYRGSIRQMDLPGLPNQIIQKFESNAIASQNH